MMYGKYILFGFYSLIKRKLEFIEDFIRFTSHWGCQTHEEISIQENMLAKIRMTLKVAFGISHGI